MRKYLLCFETNYKTTIKGDKDMENYLTRTEIEEWAEYCLHNDEFTSMIMDRAYAWHEGKSKMVIHDDIDNQFLFSAWDPVERTGNYEEDYENWKQWLLEKYSEYCFVLEESLRRKHGQIVNISKEIESNIFF